MLNKTDFAQQIRKALDHLHDVVYLQNLAVTQLLSQRHDVPLIDGARHLRTELLDAIDSIEPGGTLPPRARERRPYAILYGRYVQRMSTTALTEELAISVRQFRRENKRALHAITERLWQRWSTAGVAEEPSEKSRHVPEPHQRRAAARIETEQLIQHARAEALQLPALVNSILSVLAPVAAKYNVELRNQLPATLPAVQAERVVLRQALMELLANALDRARGGSVAIRTVGIHSQTAQNEQDQDRPDQQGLGQDKPIRMELVARGARGNSLRTGVSVDVSQQLLASINGGVVITERAEEWRAAIDLPLAETVPILVMDDNDGLVELFRRYLVDSPCRIHVAQLAEEAIALGKTVQPRLILLDVMMPEQDGWEILQKLRAAPATAATPVVICSVLNEPEIARTLGATDYLPKPVTQDALLAKISRWV